MTRNRQQARWQRVTRQIQVQRLIIIGLAVALVISIATRPTAATTTTEPIPVPSIIPIEEEPTTETVEEPELICLGEFKVTAYCTCPTCCGIWSQDHPSRIGTDYIQKTASGTIPTADRTVAVDTSVIPFGTVLLIDGQEYIAEDTGNAVKGNSIDIYYATHEEAVNHGVQYKTIYIKGD